MIGPSMPLTIAAVLIAAWLLLIGVVYRTRGAARGAVLRADKADQLAQLAHVRLDVRGGLDCPPPRGRHRLHAVEQSGGGWGRLRRQVAVRPVGGSVAAAVAGGFVAVGLFVPVPEPEPAPQPVVPAVPPPSGPLPGTVTVGPAAEVTRAPSIPARPPTVAPPPASTATATVVAPPPPPPKSKKPPAPPSPAQPDTQCQLQVVTVCVNWMGR